MVQLNIKHSDSIFKIASGFFGGGGAAAGLFLSMKEIAELVVVND